MYCRDINCVSVSTSCLQFQYCGTVPVVWYFHTPAPRRGRGYTVLPLFVCPSFRPSKIFFVAFFSETVFGRNLIFDHKRHIGIHYCGQRFWTRQIPTSCLPTQLVFIHIEHTQIPQVYQRSYSQVGHIVLSDLKRVSLLKLSDKFVRQNVRQTPPRSE